MVIIATLLAIFFILAGSQKIFAWSAAVFKIQSEFFRRYGLGRGHMYGIGIIESTAAGLIIFAILTNHEIALQLGSALILITSVGACYFHFKYDTFKDAIPAILTGCGSMFLFVSGLL
ncbi:MULTISPECIES: DoxX family protein [unclassified Pseudoalteromonas]|uniref:DoxX family protein n=1 Tax=unclassified Pseudoalteromonas TaxID=194690 RepID=UPI00209801FA|nr:DoxX family protein [Pseudoalteromonas sp. XMcav2-N]MCO7188961.1 DoxX family protein [Pseudoalteromonas sp. XMcav2-N]